MVAFFGAARLYPSGPASFFASPRRVLLLSLRLLPKPTMSSHIPISQVDPSNPTPQNTPLSHAPIAQGLSRPTVPDISEDNEPEEEESGIQHAMQGLVNAKLATLIGKSSGYVESLPENVRKSVEALKGVQVKQVELQNQYKRECLELEKKVRLIPCSVRTPC